MLLFLFLFFWRDELAGLSTDEMWWVLSSGLIFVPVIKLFSARFRFRFLFLFSIVHVLLFFQLSKRGDGTEIRTFDLPPEFIQLHKLIGPRCPACFIIVSLYFVPTRAVLKSSFMKWLKSRANAPAGPSSTLLIFFSYKYCLSEWWWWWVNLTNVHRRYQMSTVDWK